MSLCSEQTATGKEVLLDAYPAEYSKSTTCICSATLISEVPNSLFIDPHVSLAPSNPACGTRFDISVQSDITTEEKSRECGFTRYNLLIGLQASLNITYTKSAADGVDNSYCLKLTLCEYFNLRTTNFENT